MTLLSRMLSRPPERGSIRVETVNGRPRVYLQAALRIETPEPCLVVGVRQRVTPWRVM